MALRESQLFRLLLGPLGEAMPAQGGARAWVKATAAAIGPGGGSTAFAPPVSALDYLEWPIGRGNERIDRETRPWAFVTTIFMLDDYFFVIIRVILL